jgi:hypothetical protein
MSEEKNLQVLMETSMGNVTIELFKDKAPITVRNFLSYVKEGFFDGLIFHRVIANFMIQGGGMDENMHKADHFAIKNEAVNELSNKGHLAMARPPWTAPPPSSSTWRTRPPGRPRPVRLCGAQPGDRRDGWTYIRCVKTAPAGHWMCR